LLGLDSVGAPLTLLLISILWFWLKDYRFEKQITVLGPNKFVESSQDWLTKVGSNSIIYMHKIII